MRNKAMLDALQLNPVKLADRKGLRATSDKRIQKVMPWLSQVRNN